jgi:Polysaccharide lyase
MSFHRTQLRRRVLLACVSLMLTAICTTIVWVKATARASSSSKAFARRGSVLYRENWETGALGAGQWGAQCNNLTQPNFATRGSFTPEQNTVGQGRWAARFNLPADITRPTACEVIHGRTLDLGSNDYYAFDVYFPKTWREPSGAFWGLIIAQFNYEAIYGPPVGLVAHRNYVNLVIGGGYYNGSTTKWYTGNGVARGNLPRMYAIPRPLKLGVWHQLIIHVRWSAGPSGAVDVEHRVRGKGSWKRTVHFRGYPTIQWSQTRPATSGMPTSDKIGAYRDRSSFPISIWNDGFCRASSFRAAESCL